MITLHEERQVLSAFKEKLTSNKNLSQDELLNMCSQFEDTIELASVSIKIIDRLRDNYANLKKELVKR